MPEETPHPSPKPPKNDRLWLVLCTATGVAVDVTLNKYSSKLPGLAVVAIWAVPTILFAIWFVRVETTKSWVKTRFLEHPVSYVLMFLILIPFGWQATATMITKIRNQTDFRIAKLTRPPQTSPTIPAPPADTSPQSLSQATPFPTKPNFISKLRHPLRQELPATTHTPTNTSQPIYGQTCVGSACAQGPGSQATFNQYGPPEAKIFGAIEKIDSSTGYKVEISVTVENDWQNAAFVVKCDRPCSGEDSVEGLGGVGTRNWTAPENPNWAVMKIEMPAMVPQGSVIHWWVRSNDGKPMTITAIQKATIHMASQ